MRLSVVTFIASVLCLCMSHSLCAATPPRDFSPPPQERQLPTTMHSAMEERPHITVGVEAGDLIGSDHRALQAAVDYVANLGGGLVEIGAGEYLMRDSLHLRPNVTVRGVAGKTVLRKADGVVTPLALDGDFGEEQITVADPAGFAIGAGVAIWDDRAGGFHTTVARITGRTGHTFSIDKPLMADCMVHNHARAATVFPVVSGYYAENARVENLVIEGNRTGNVHLNGCRGAGIFRAVHRKANKRLGLDLVWRGNVHQGDEVCGGALRGRNVQNGLHALSPCLPRDLPYHAEGRLELHEHHVSL